MITRHFLVANQTPFFERRLREDNRVINIGSNNIPSKIIVGSMTIALELSESRDDIGQRGFDRSRIVFVLGFEGRILHFLVIKHPRQACPLICELPAFNEVLDKQMKDRVVCSRDGAAHARFPILGVAFRG